MERQLVSLKTISEIRPIQDADFIEEAIVGGWHTVVKKGEFQPGDIGIFLEIDSLLDPEQQWVKDFASFMEKTKWRVRTCKLRGVLSQGLLLPLTIIPEGIPINEDMDLMSILNIRKYEIPEVPGSGFAGQARGNFPNYLVPKTDEIRLQSVLGCIDELKGKPYYISVKCDGTSGTWLYLADNDFVGCSRNQMKKDDEFCVYYKIARKYDISEKLKNFPKRISVQGEICGPGIQGNPMGLKEIELFVFNIYDIDERRYMDYEDFIAICKQLELQTVPILEIGDSFNYGLDELLELADGKYPISGKPQEGIVVRPLIETYSEVLHDRLSFKIINNTFLLKEK
jgi:RNA ligase (TIGR02306 family)